MSTNEKIKNRKEEIQCIYELLQACLEEEGYVIPFWKPGDVNWSSFNVQLKNPLYKEPDNLSIKIEWS